MTMIALESEMLASLADRIEEDILRRDLRRGDLYLSTSEVAGRFSTSRASANRAMEILAGRGILERRQGRGTFVGASMRRNARKVFQTISLLYPSEAIARTDPESWAMLRTLGGGISFGSLQINFIPDHDRLEFIRQLVDSGRRSGTLSGLIAVSLDALTYDFLARCPLPSVIVGSKFSPRKGLVNVNLNYQEAGRLLARHFLRKGCRRFLVAAPLRHAAGVRQLTAGVRGQLELAGLPPSALSMRHFPGGSAGELNAPGRTGAPVAVIADGYSLADELHHASRPGGPFEIGCVAPMLSRRKDCPYIQAISEAEPADHLRQIVSLLERLHGGERLADQALETPVRLFPPPMHHTKARSQLYLQKESVA